jgi:uncharacterized protein YndB with AHSA1/START domain
VITFKTNVRIGRPIEEVYAYLSDPRNFPHWNSAVREVRETSQAKRYSMERQLPTGRAVNSLEIVALEPPREFAVRTTSGPTPFVYRYLFSSEGGETVVELDAQVELDGAASLVPQLARRAVKNGVEENFARLKKIQEVGVS